MTFTPPPSILTNAEVAMLQAVLGGMQVEIRFGEWPRVRSIFAPLLEESRVLVAHPRDQREYLIGQMRVFYFETVIQKHEETFRQRPNADPMEIMCPLVGHRTIGSRARTAITIDARLTL